MKASRFYIFFVSFLLVGLGLFLKTNNLVNKSDSSGLVAGTQTSLLPPLPPDLPIPTQTTLRSALQKNDGWEVVLETSVEPLVVEKYFKDKLVELGWRSQGKLFLKEGKKLSWKVVQNEGKTQSVVVLDYVFVPTK